MDGQNVTKFCVPKLLALTICLLTFQVGETVKGRMNNTGLSQITSDSIGRNSI